MDWWARNWYFVAIPLLVAAFLVVFNLLADAGHIKVDP